MGVGTSWLPDHSEYRSKAIAGWLPYYCREWADEAERPICPTVTPAATVSGLSPALLRIKAPWLALIVLAVLVPPAGAVPGMERLLNGDRLRHNPVSICVSLQRALKGRYAGVRIIDNILVTDTGVELLSTTPRDLFVIH
jgi:hypothetical protein